MLSRLLLFIGLMVLSGATYSSTLRVAVATNFYPALILLKPQFEQQHQVELQLISGSSGVFYAQIVNGAPFDVFLSADKYRPSRLVEKNLTLGKALHYATGKLVWWQPNLPQVSIDDIQQYTGKVAMANPKFAPYGVAATDVITYLNLTNAISVIKGNNVGQAMQFVDSTNANAGFVAQSQLVSGWQKHRDKKYLNFVELPLHWYSDIHQYMVLLRQSKNTKEAKLFVEFISSDAVQKQLQNLGYR